MTSAVRQSFDPAYLFFRHLVIPAYEGLAHRRRTFSIWKDLEKTQWLSSQEVARLQFDAVKRLIAHASSTSRYFQEEWQRLGLTPDALRTPEDFARFPLTTKDQMREHRATMRSTRPAGRVMTKRTGGSTGTFLEFDYDDQSLERRMATWHRGYSWAGGGPGTRQFYFWGVASGRSRQQRAKDWLYEHIYRRTFVDTLNYRDDDVDLYLDQLTRCAPDVIIAYTNPLFALARALDARGKTPPSPRAIIVGAEQLHRTQRTLIERVFGAPVFDTYGAREFMLMGAECEQHDGFHLSAEHLMLEIVDDDGVPVEAGREGHIVVTDLYNYALPFIRYMTGDRGVAATDPCQCGRGLPRLASVTGRTLDLVVTPDGRHLPGEYFVRLLGLDPRIRQFQVVQSARNMLIVRLVLDPAKRQAELADIRTELDQLAGAEMRVAVEILDAIPLTAAGKLLVVVNQWQRDAVASRRAGDY
ncbi:MAG TPA: hypothetical protein VF491_16695 [Vicinamibacterales bacterium]